MTKGERKKHKRQLRNNGGRQWVASCVYFNHRLSMLKLMRAAALGQRL